MRPRRRSLVSLLSVLACAWLLLAATVHAAGGRPSGLLSIPDDPSSTFRLGTASLADPLTTVEIPVYLDTPNQVAFFNCQIGWTAADLTLIEVTYGAGAPAGSGTLSVDPAPPGGGGISFHYSTQGFGPLTIPSGSPIAVLRLQVECFGYWVQTGIDFFETPGQTTNNFYNTAAGISMAPTRQSGWVQTPPDWVYFNGPFEVQALPGQDDVAMLMRWQHTIPGQPLRAVIAYDPARLAFLSVEPDAGLLGGSVIATPGPGLVDVAITSGVLPTSTNYLFTMHFRLVTNDDNYSSQLNFTTGSQTVNVCGVVTNIVGGNAGKITVPNHTATVDIQNVSAYTTATSYDVPVQFASNFPVHDYELWVQYPASQLQFVETVAVAGFPVPSISVDQNNPGLLNIHEGSPSGPGQPVYTQSQLPADVFKMRFAPVSSPAAGTSYAISFQPNPQNEVAFFIETNPLVRSFADLMLLPGTITITTAPPGGGGPGCPTLYAWDGSHMRRENTILAACDGVKSGSEVTDHYLVGGPVIPTSDGRLRFQIREDEQQVSEFRDFQLVVVDHPVGRDIQVTASGEVMALEEPYAMAWARDHLGNDVTALVTALDKVPYKSNTSGWLDVSFGALRDDQIGDRLGALLSDGLRKRPPTPTQKAARPGAPGSKMVVSVRTPAGGWETIERADARLEPTRQAAILDPKTLEPGQELVLRYEWEGSYEVDAVEFRLAARFTGERWTPHLASASHSLTGDVMEALAAPGASEPVILAPGQKIDVAFDASGLPPLHAGTRRSYVFAAVGRYDDIAAPADPSAGFGLEPNVPNPFNPSTTIRFSLARQAHVVVKIHDVSGALVRTLLSGVQPAGRREIVWDGRDELGAPVASGTYIYTLETPEQRGSQKMTLVR